MGEMTWNCLYVNPWGYKHGYRHQYISFVWVYWEVICPGPFLGNYNLIVVIKNTQNENVSNHAKFNL